VRIEETRETLRRYGVRPKRELGQSFLIDEMVASRITDAAGLSESETVVEIGAGLGILTELLARRAERVIAVEVDARLFKALRVRLQQLENLTLLNQDILRLDFGELLRQEKIGTIKVVGNLPYQITSQILNCIIENRALIKLAVLTLQDEVARRVVSAPGKREYGLLSILVQYYTRPELLFSIKPSCFYPSPRVLSTVVRLNSRASPPISVNEELFLRLVKASFSRRRKMLKNALRASFSEDILKRLSVCSEIDLRRRAETLSILEFGELTDGLSRAMRSP